MRAILSNNVIRRLFSTTNTKKIIPCISCKHYNIDNQTCKRFVDYDVSGNTLYYTVKSVRNDDNKCGLEKMIGYEPILQDLLNEHNKIKSKCEYYDKSSEITGWTGCLLLGYTVLIQGNMITFFSSVGLLVYSYNASETFSDLKKAQDKLQRRIDACQDLHK